jgi:hypothetical protein
VTTLKSSSHWLGLIKGGPGSGNHGHCGGQGGPGNPGGSSSAGECGTSTAKPDNATALGDEFFDWLEDHLAGRPEADLSQWWKHRGDKEYALRAIGTMAVANNVSRMSTAATDKLTREFDLGLSFWGRHKQGISNGLESYYQNAFELVSSGIAEDYKDKSLGDVFLDTVERSIADGHWARFGISKENEINLILALSERAAQSIDFRELEARDFWAKSQGKIDLNDIRHGGRAAASKDIQGLQPVMESLMEARARHLMGPDADFADAKKNFQAYWQSWLNDSQSPLGHWMAHVASKELGAPSTMRGRENDVSIDGNYSGVKDFLNRNQGGVRIDSIADTNYKTDAAMIKATWEVAQLALRDEPESMILFRGIKPREDSEIDFTTTEVEGLLRRTDITLKSSALQSSSTSFSSASAFGKIESDHPLHSEISDILETTDEDGYRMDFVDPVMLVGVDIPKAKIFSVPSYGANDAGEEEYVILGGDWDQNSRVYLMGLGNSDRLSDKHAESAIRYEIEKRRGKRAEAQAFVEKTRKGGK